MRQHFARLRRPVPALEQLAEIMAEAIDADDTPETLKALGPSLAHLLTQSAPPLVLRG